MSCTNKKVAILLATYNGEHYITDQLESIKNQTYKDFVVYIHDDDSKDRTVEKIEQYCEFDDRFKLIKGQKCGSAKENFLFLMKCINKEEYIMFCDQDDYWLPEKIAVYIETMEKNEENNEAICIYSDLMVVDEKLQIINPSYYTFSGKEPKKNDFRSLVMNNVVVGCTMMINQKLLLLSQEINDHELIYMHDWWIALIASIVGKLVYIERSLTLYRQHTDNSVGAVRKKSYIKKLFDCIVFKNYNHNRERIQRSINFCRALNSKNIICQYNSLIDDMAHIKNYSWFHRAWFFLKNRFIPLNRIGKIFWL